MTDAAAPSTPDPQPGETPQGADDAWLDTEIPQGADVFDRKYVEDIRHKSANFRARAHAAEERATALEPFDVFTQFDERDQGVWTDLASKWRVDPASSAQVMRDIANRVLGDETPAIDPSTPPAQETTPMAFESTPSMTPDDVAEIVQNALNTKAAEDQAASAMNDLHSKIADAGYEKDSRESLNVLWYLNRDPECAGDLPKAIEKFKNADQGVIDEFVAGKNVNPLPMAPGGTGGQDTPSEPRRGFELQDARKDAEAWLESQSASR